MGKLTALEVKRLSKPGKYGDGRGLWLQVRDAEHKSWLLRFMLNGKAREMGLGPLDLVSLAEARDKAVAGRKLLLEGIDPLEARDADRAAKLAKAGAMTFQQTAERYITAHKAAWKNDKHVAQWGATLATYVYPLFGSRPVAEVETADVMRALTPIWTTKPETASRVRGRIEVILDYARAMHWRTGENPARWKGHAENLLPKKTKVRAVKHHAALPWQHVAGFLTALEEETGVGAWALRFAILTAARTGEVLGAKWSEIDLDAKAWTIPASRMKAQREHRVPLTDATIVILQQSIEAYGRSPDAYIFPGARKGQPLSNMAMPMLLRRMSRDDVTVHGFRSAFRDWAAEATSYANEIAEAALAHTIGSKVEAAYRRGDLFEKRRAMMADWAAHCLPVAKLAAVA